MNNNKSDDDRSPVYKNLLEDLYSLQKNLLPNKTSRTQTDTDKDSHSLEISILIDVIDREIEDERQLTETFNGAQQHLFDQSTTPQPVTEEQINAVVVKLMARMRPKIEQILRNKIHSMVKERFNRENWSQPPAPTSIIPCLLFTLIKPPELEAELNNG